MGSGWLRLGIAVLGTAVGAATQAIQMGAGATPERALIAFVVGEAYLLGGLFAGGRDPANRTWWIMTAAGIGWFVGDFAASADPLLRAVGVILADTDAILLTALVLAYPTGRLVTRAHRATVAIAAVGLTAANVVAWRTGDATLNLVFGLAVTAAVGVLVPLRWIRAPREQRASLTPPVLAMTVTVTAIAIAIVVRLADVGEQVAGVLLAVRDVGVLAIPIGFVVGSFQLAQEELHRSRRRLVDASDSERRRLERDLHDGAQQRFVGLSISLRMLAARLDGGGDPVVAETLDAAREELKAGITELRELARGIHPAALTAGGLAGALPTLVERSPVPAALLGVPEARFAPPVEVTAYFLVSEALANVAKHANATQATVLATVTGDGLDIEVRDDGVGGVGRDDGERLAAQPAGTGLAGLRDRVLALGGTLSIDSPPGRGTTIRASIPLAAEGAATASGPV
jgi:signal transduction histidine kinase